MNRRTTLFIFTVIGAATAVLLQLRGFNAATARDELTAVAVLSALSLLAEMLTLVLPKGAYASIASIPALAAILISPSWGAVLGIATAKALVESAKRIEFEKAIFNTAQYTLSLSLAATVYAQLGGEALINNGASLSALTNQNGLPSLAAFITLYFTNTLLVSSVIAISSGSRITSIWRANSITMIGMDFVTSPLIFLFAWAFVQFGAIAAAALWIPIIGIRQVHKSNLELEQTNVELLDLMVKSIEARDPYTSGHSRRVQDYSILISRALGLSEKDIQAVGRAALLHDVGKIHEKYGPILRKADRLTADEWNTMREHPADGAELVATMTRLRDLAGAVRHHHENWDGSGYPDGMVGELIPLAARIIRFADTIDAMTTERPYRPQMSPEQVRAEIVRCRGTQFDPQIVDRLLSSPTWRTMFAPLGTPSRYGNLAVMPNRSLGHRAVAER